jgi:DNA topoisomerase-1
VGKSSWTTICRTGAAVALRLIVNVEREIEAFKPEEYWTIGAEFSPEGSRTKYLSRFYRMDDQDPVFYREETTVNDLCRDMEKAAYVITKIKKSERRRKPAPPYHQHTSTGSLEKTRFHRSSDHGGCRNSFMKG